MGRTLAYKMERVVNTLDKAIALLRRSELSRCVMMNRYGGSCEDCLSNDIKEFVQTADTDMVPISTVKDALSKAVPTHTCNRIINDIRRDYEK